MMDLTTVRMLLDIGVAVLVLGLLARAIEASTSHAPDGVIEARIQTVLLAVIAGVVLLSGGQ
jgi:hypothetical protein